MAKNQDVGRALTYQIKREIAERYFGFRKLIEEDKALLAKKMQLQTMTLEQNLCRDFARLYILMHDEEGVEAFLTVVGLEQRVYYDPYLKESRQLRERLLGGMRVRGLTARRRFGKLVRKSYEHLYQHVVEYRKGLDLLLEEREFINEEIRLFYKKNDLSEIMSFMRTLDTACLSGDGLAGEIQCGLSEDLENKLRVESIPAMDEYFPAVPALPPWPKIRKQMAVLADRAFFRHRHHFTDFLK